MRSKIHRLFVLLLVLLGAASAASLAAEPPSMPAPRMSLTDLEPFVDKLVREAMEAEHLPGAAFVLVHDGKIRMAKGWGLANVESGVRVDPDRTLFRIGSITKVFTAMAVAQLQDKGRIDLEADVNRYLGPVKVPKAFGEPVRVRQ